MSKQHHHHEPGSEKEQEFVGPHDEEQLQEEKAVQEEQTPDYYDKFVRLTAEFDNFRKRTEREKAAFIGFGKKQLAEKLLPSYEILLRQQEKWAKEKDVLGAETKNLLEGVKMITAELDKAFRSEGIEKMDVLDKPYDPATQEVVAMIPSSEAQDGLVLQEVQMGFTMDGKVLRLARVIVGQHAEG